MARPKKLVAQEVAPTEQKQFRVIRKLKSEINHRAIVAQVDDLIMLSPFEAEILQNYIKEE